jgi:hypothetical protein
MKELFKKESFMHEFWNHLNHSTKVLIIIENMQELLEKKLASSLFVCLFVKLVFKIQENIFHISNG